MIIRSITLNNYRLYKGNNKIVFENNNSQNIFLISGENGFGKTTFLHSLLWCLYGRLVADVEVNIRKELMSNGYNSLLKTNLNHSQRLCVENLDIDTVKNIKKNGYNSETEAYKDFSQYFVEIEFSDVVIPSIPCNSLIVRRGYDYITEKEFIDIFIDGQKNELTNEIGPDIFINDFILNKDIARFFFFDSEQIVALAETNTAAEKRKLCSAYNEVLGVRKYEELKHNLENVRLRFRKKSSDIDSRNKLFALIEKQGLKKNEVEGLKTKSDNFDVRLSELNAKNLELQEQLMREGNNTTVQEIDRLQTVLDTTRNKDTEFKSQLKDFLEYAPLALAGNLLSKTKSRVEKDFNISKQNENLSNRNLIISDITSDLLLMIHRADITEGQKVQLQGSVQDILAKYQGNISSEETLTSLSQEDFEEFTSIYTYITSTYRSEFERLTEDYKKNRQILERTARRLSTIQSKENDALIKNIREEKNSIEQEIAKLHDEIKDIHVQIGIKNQELGIITKQVSELSKKVNLSDIDNHKDELAESLISELNEFLFALKQEKKYSLERRIKSILNSLMHKEDFIQHVEVNIVNEDMDIELYSTDENVINKDSLSKGEQQLYATSILKSLVEESGIQFPVFIDSPLQKFDKSHATKIITEFYPQISKQVILFPLLYKELTADELDVMKPLVNSAYLIKNDVTHSYFEKVDVDKIM